MISLSHTSSVSWFRRHAVLAYFLLTYAISWLAALAVVGPKLIRHQSLGHVEGLLMFPAMLLGPPASSILLTRLLEGRSGVHALFRRMTRFCFAPRWWLMLFIPPGLVLLTLFALKAVVSHVFSPGFFPKGILFGCVAGFLEEIGWTGFAFPLMARHGHPFRAAALLGFLWGFWHLPVINFLGAASPHGAALPTFAAAFIAAMAAIRILIAQLYIGTHSLGLAQCMHACSTASLVLFSATAITPMQEVLWYAIYAVLLWVVVLYLCCNRDFWIKTRVWTV